MSVCCVSMYGLAMCGFGWYLIVFRPQVKRSGSINYFSWPEEIGAVSVKKVLDKPQPKNSRNSLGCLPSGRTARKNVIEGIRAYALEHGENPHNVELFGDVDCSAKFFHFMHGKVPCMLHSHVLGAWSTRRRRRLNLAERARFR